MNRNESNTRAIRALSGKFSNRSHRKPEAAAVVAVPVEAARIEAEVPRIVRIARIRRRRPAAAVRADVEVGPAAVAGGGEENTLRRIRPFAPNKSPANTIARSPLGRALFA